MFDSVYLFTDFPHIVSTHTILQERVARKFLAADVPEGDPRAFLENALNVFDMSSMSTRMPTDRPGTGGTTGTTETTLPYRERT
jgi:hypothetical protein